MFRRWPTILFSELPDDESAAEARQRDADVIMTATILGFTAAQLSQSHPVTYTYDYADRGKQKERDMVDAVKRVNAALGPDYRYGNQATADAAPEWKLQEMISASPGKASLPFGQRHKVPRAEAAKVLRTLAAGIDDDAIGYQGPGAYTGFVDDPVGHRGSIQSTKRYNVPEVGYGSRWVPDAYAYPTIGDQDTVPWGLIGDQRSVGKGMLEQPFDMSGDGSVVGYTHGMIQAIYESAWTGPWCTPYEIAVGTETTKLASCFTCTLFMYANGYPPSAIHLGQGASWVPWYEVRPGLSVGVEESDLPAISLLHEEPLADKRIDSEATEEFASVDVIASEDDERQPLIEDLPKPRKEPYTYAGSANRYQLATDSVIAALNARWHIECGQHLALGIRVMKQNDGARVEARRRGRIAVLEQFLSDNKDDPYAAANLILDAVTVHDGEVSRVIRTLAAG